MASGRALRITQRNSPDEYEKDVKIVTIISRALLHSLENVSVEFINSFRPDFIQTTTNKFFLI